MALGLRVGLGHVRGIAPTISIILVRAILYGCPLPGGGLGISALRH